MLPFDDGMDLDDSSVADLDSFDDATDVEDDALNDDLDDISSTDFTPDSNDLPDSQDLQNFDPAQVSDDVIGDPASAMEHYQTQSYADDCGVMSQYSILNQRGEESGQCFSEDGLCQQAISQGLYISGGGTPLESMGGLLEANGIPVEREYGNKWEDLAEKLEQGESINVALDSDEIWTPGFDAAKDDNLGDYVEGYGCIPGQDSNHAVQVIGIDNSDPTNPMVILNDPGIPSGKGVMIPRDEFMGAWADSNYYMVSTVTQGATDIQDSGYQPMVGSDYDKAAYYQSYSDYYKKQADWYAA